MTSSAASQLPERPHATAPPMAVATLAELAAVLPDAPDLRAGLQGVFALLARKHRMRPIVLTLLARDEDASEDEIEIVASAGLEAGARPIRYRLGEGITGRVVASGKPIVVPRVAEEPLFVYRAVRPDSARDLDRTFLCVPVRLAARSIGALSVTVPFEAGRDYAHDVQVLEVAAALIAQEIKLEKLIESERRTLLDENRHLRAELKERYDFANIIGSSHPMQAVYRQITQVANASTTVLIRGESGTGKELIAHAIHYNSSRSAKPFVRLNCAALPEGLIESELFGHERGAFTGATSRKKGRFELAEGGTLFLDEIGDLSPATQMRLLRVLQEREFERVGGTETLRVDVRVLAATHRDLEAAVLEGIFREDLFYRLSVFPIQVPPLRVREDDIPLLADHFLQRFAKQQGKQLRRVTTAAIDMLLSYHWPGNVRELENALERATLIADGEVVDAHHLPPTLQTAEASGTVTRVDLATAVARYEKDLILDALKSARGNKAKTARLLGTTERIIGYKIRKYGIVTRASGTTG